MSVRSISWSLAAFSLLMVWSAGAMSAPAIGGVSGNAAHGEQLTIQGTGFGVKSPAKPYLWAPFDGSINPSPLGRATAWDRVENMGYAAGEGFGGQGAMKASNSSGTWTAGVLSSGFAWNDYNQQMYVFRRVKRNFDIPSDLNWKIIRVWGWGSEGLRSPNWYSATNNGNLSVEGVGSGGWPYDAGIVSPISGGNLQAARGRANEWRTDEILTQANSSANSEDAKFYHYVDGALVGVMPYTNYAYRGLKLRSTDSSSDSMHMLFPVHGVKANATLPSHYRYWVDDVYVDTTWARVMIGNAPNLGASTHLEIQIPHAWSSTSVGVTVNTRTFPAGDRKYLFVIDAQGNASPGFPLDGSVPAAPAGVTLQQSN